MNKADYGAALLRAKLEPAAYAARKTNGYVEQLEAVVARVRWGHQPKHGHPKECCVCAELAILDEIIALMGELHYEAPSVTTFMRESAGGI